MTKLLLNWKLIKYSFTKSEVWIWVLIIRDGPTPTPGIRDPDLFGISGSGRWDPDLFAQDPDPKEDPDPHQDPDSFWDPDPRFLIKISEMNFFLMFKAILS